MKEFKGTSIITGPEGLKVEPFIITQQEIDSTIQPGESREEVIEYFKLDYIDECQYNYETCIILSDIQTQRLIELLNKN